MKIEVEISKEMMHDIRLLLSKYGYKKDESMLQHLIMEGVLGIKRTLSKSKQEFTVTKPYKR